MPLVVLLHGTMDRSSSFTRVGRELPEFDVVTYDRRVATRVDEHIEDLREAIGRRRAVVVGHSFGGTIALTAAVRHPDLLAAVGAYEPPLTWMPWWPAGSAAEMVGDRGPEEAAEWFFRRTVGDRVWERLPDHTRRQRLAEGKALLGDMAALRVEPPPFTVEDLVASPVPIGIASGTDSKDHQRAGAAGLAARTGLELTVIDGATHGAHRSHPEPFAAWVRQLVDLST